jgi:hypothetical protein
VQRHRLPSASLTADGVSGLPEQRKHSVHVCNVLNAEDRGVLSDMLPPVIVMVTSCAGIPLIDHAAMRRV